jgi:carboxypeptidase Taq
VLQDVHWAHGSFGYFPTYTIGNLAAAQFWASYCRYDPDYQQTLASGNLPKIRDWLGENIYRHGAVYPPEELIERVTGEKLSEVYFLQYLTDKFGGGQ